MSSTKPEAVRKRTWRKNKQLMQEDHDFLQDNFHDCLEDKPKPKIYYSVIKIYAPKHSDAQKQPF